MKPNSKTSARIFRISIQILWMVTLCSAIVYGSAPVSEYPDGFEGPRINAFWTVTQQSGTVSLSTQQAHGGRQSLQFASTAGGQRMMMISHVLGAMTKGTVSVAFYDVAPYQQTFHEKIEVSSVVSLK